MPFGPMGHVYDQPAIQSVLASSPTPSFASTADRLWGSGEGKTVCLWKSLEKLLGGQFPIRNQTIGDCVSQAWASAIDFLQAVEIEHGDEEMWMAPTASEWIYYTSRVLIGNNKLGNGDGSVGAWAGRAVTEYGVLQQLQYESYDLRQYDGQRAKIWGSPRGPWPTELRPKAQPFTVTTTSQITTYQQARDAIANGFPVVVCSNVGFEDHRDSEGFARASGVWNHAMCFCGVDDNRRRPGLLCLNSWGPSWISGPKRLGQPDGSFWVDAQVADRMLGRWPDSWAPSNYKGYPKRDLRKYLCV